MGKEDHGDKFEEGVEMKKLIKIWIIVALVFSFIPISSGFADEEAGQKKSTNAASDAAANAANAASADGINIIYIEAGIFLSAMALMAASMASGSDNTNAQPSSHNSGHSGH